MARKRKKRSSSAQQVSTWSRLQDYFISESFAGFNRRLVRIVLLLAVMAAVGVGFTYLDRYVHRITEQREVELTVSLVNPPAWATADLIKDICLSSGLRRDDFILDEKLTARWFANLAANPWVKHIRQIRKRYDGRIEIDCELRQPIAVISKGVHKRYVDTDGVILPAAPLVPGHCHLVEMRDRVDVRALPDVGEPLASKALISGLELLSMVRRMDAELDDGPPLLPELAVLDVSNFEGQINQAASHLTLYTQNNTEVRWGAALGRSAPYNEAPFRQKLATLYITHRQHGFAGRSRYVELRDRPKHPG